MRIVLKKTFKNFNLIFLRIEVANSVYFKCVQLSYFLINNWVFVWVQQIIHHFEGVLIENVNLNKCYFK